MEMACPFANFLVKDPPNNPYRENFKRCNGDLVPVNECKDEIDKEHVKYCKDLVMEFSEEEILSR